MFSVSTTWRFHVTQCTRPYTLFRPRLVPHSRERAVYGLLHTRLPIVEADRQKDIICALQLAPIAITNSALVPRLLPCDGPIPSPLRLETEAQCAGERERLYVVRVREPGHPPEPEPRCDRVRWEVQAVAEKQGGGECGAARPPVCAIHETHGDRRAQVHGVAVRERHDPTYGARLLDDDGEGHVCRVAAVLELEELEDVDERFGRGVVHEAEVFGEGQCVLEEQNGMKSRDKRDELDLVCLEALGIVRETEIKIVRSWAVELVWRQCGASEVVVRVAPWLVVCMDDYRVVFGTLNDFDHFVGNLKSLTATRVFIGELKQGSVFVSIVKR